MITIATNEGRRAAEPRRAQSGQGRAGQGALARGSLLARFARLCSLLDTKVLISSTRPPAALALLQAPGRLGP